LRGVAYRLIVRQRSAGLKDKRRLASEGDVESVSLGVLVSASGSDSYSTFSLTSAYGPPGHAGRFRAVRCRVVSVFLS
jgi:hypothetical protein